MLRLRSTNNFLTYAYPFFGVNRFSDYSRTWDNDRYSMNAVAGLYRWHGYFCWNCSRDFVFIGLAVFGLSTLSQSLGELFLITQYGGAAYLFWLEVTIAAVFLHQFSKTTSHIEISVP